jgi:hypothetical protein
MEQLYRRGTVVSLAVALGLLAAATGLFAALDASRQDDIGRLREQIAATEGSIASAQARRTTAVSTVDGLNAAWTQLEATNKKLHACADPAKDSVIAADKNDLAGLDQALDKVIADCGR